MFQKQFKILSVILFSVALFVPPAVSDTVDNQGMTFPSSRFDFGTVPEGAVVSHVFEIPNDSDTELALNQASAGCSCVIINSYDERIAPGAAGAVSVSFDTSGYGGNTMVREIKVQTSDRDMPELTLSLTGVVEKVYTLSPEIAKLTGKITEEVQTTVNVFPEEKYAFHILGARAQKGVNIEYAVEEINQGGRKGFALKIKSKAKNKGLFFDKIFLDTDSDVVPEITIGVFAKIKDA